MLQSDKMWSVWQAIVEAIFYMEVLPILCFQQLLVVTFDTKRKIRAWNDVSPVALNANFVSFLLRQKQTKI